MEISQYLSPPSVFRVLASWSVLVTGMPPTTLGRFLFPSCFLDSTDSRGGKRKGRNLGQRSRGFEAPWWPQMAQGPLRSPERLSVAPEWLYKAGCAPLFVLNGAGKEGGLSEAPKRPHLPVGPLRGFQLLGSHTLVADSREPILASKKPFFLRIDLPENGLRIARLHPSNGVSPFVLELYILVGRSSSSSKVSSSKVSSSK